MESDVAQSKKGARLKPLYIVLIVVLAVAVIAGAYFAINSASSQVVTAGKNVSVYYTGEFTNGTVFDSNVGGQPLQFTAGSNQLIPGFSNAVIGMTINQSKKVTLSPSEAYGPVNQSLIVNVPITVFGNQTISVGEVVTTSTYMQGIVTAVNATNATVDFNPPLAGKTLVFNITVVSIKK